MTKLSKLAECAGFILEVVYHRIEHEYDGNFRNVVNTAGIILANL
jgi:hypothetical protein